MKLHKDISNWAAKDIRIISIKSDVCPVPLQLSVRRFVPIPEDSLHKGWMDGKIKKWKEVTPFAIVNMSKAAKDMCEYINAHVFHCMDFFLRGRDDLVRETYTFARKYMPRAVSFILPKLYSMLSQLIDYSLTKRRLCWATSSDYGSPFVALQLLSIL